MTQPFLIATLVISCIIISLLSLVLIYLRKYNSFHSLENILSALKENEEEIEQMVRDEVTRNREELNKGMSESRIELAQVVKNFENSVLSRMKDNENSQKNQLDIFSKELTSLTALNEQKLEKMRETIQERIKSLQEENSKKLDQMRVVVEEKLHTTLEKRLGESFKMVSDRLESVYKGLGEMQSLALSVGDLKKVLANVKARGTWGEIQLGNILEQMLTPEQYAKNIITKKGSSFTVEFAVKFPIGKNKTVWLPIDAKFPKEDYERLIDAQERADIEAVNEIYKSLENTIKNEAKDIREKYIDPPNTTDIGILFLGTEGLYAEALRKPGLSDFLRTKYRVIITGPTTIAALLNIIQMGTQAFAIEERASLVWDLLRAVKSDFAKFGELLTKTQEKLKQASETIELAEKKSRTIENKLDKAQQLPTPEETVVLETADSAAKQLES
jgi:DNA recombination protein RmuC